MFRWLGLVFRSFGPAWAGLLWAFKTQRNVQVHTAASGAVAALGLWLKIAPWEWCAVVLASGLVWCAELLNTAIEVLADRVSKAREEVIGRTKDVAAAGVLMAAVGALLVGMFIFLPKLWALL